MRQTGRTTRIAQFAVDQLFNVGEVIITDHLVFEMVDLKQRYLNPLIEKVEDLIVVLGQNRFKVTSEIKRLDKLYVVHFKMKLADKPKGDI